MLLNGKIELTYVVSHILSYITNPAYVQLQLQIAHKLVFKETNKNKLIEKIKTKMVNITNSKTQFTFLNG